MWFVKLCFISNNECSVTKQNNKNCARGNGMLKETNLPGVNGAVICETVCYY